MRCNRESPCGSCIVSKTGSCVYETEISVQIPNGTRPIQPRDAEASAMGAPRVPSMSAGGYTSSLSTCSMSSSHSSLELNAMRTRIAELEDKLSRATSTTGSVCSPSSTHAVHTVSSFACTVDVLQDTRMPDGAEISRGMAHKNRVFGQSHWMNGFVMVSMQSC